MFIETVSTPNPNTLKFIPGCDVLPGSTREYKNPIEAEESPLAAKIFLIDGVSGVFSYCPALSGSRQDAHFFKYR